jgi:PPOX class probable F420-dependent enzyme
MRLDPDEARRRFAAADVAHLATIRPDGRPHVVPVTFVVDGDKIEMAVDAKPKASRNLARLRNIEANPAVSLLVDHYAAEWGELWWVRADGEAGFQTSATEHAALVGRLLEKYPQYGQSADQFGTALVVQVTRWSGWAYSGAA